MTDEEKAERFRKECDRVRAASGNVSDPRPLVAFLYELMRDEVPPGRIEALVDKINPDAEEWVFTNGWLARHAQDIASRLADLDGP